MLVIILLIFVVNENQVFIFYFCLMQIILVRSCNEVFVMAEISQNQAALKYNFLDYRYIECKIHF